MSESQETLIFVYGTLKRGCRNHAYLADQKFIGEARTAPGYRLYSLGRYPGMVARPDDREGVTGELWSVDAVGLDHLDALEGLAEGLYTRDPIPLVAPHAHLKVEAYFYARPLTGRAEVGSTWEE